MRVVGRVTPEGDEDIERLTMGKRGSVQTRNGME
jgi:hypothetical protein